MGAIILGDTAWSSQCDNFLTVAIGDAELLSSRSDTEDTKNTLKKEIYINLTCICNYGSAIVHTRTRRERESRADIM